MDSFDVVIVGGGVIGCSVARAALLEQPALKVCLVEKEPQLASHQSGRNSGVVHAGYNQKPGTLKAKFVVEGSRRIREFCRKRGVSLDESGILAVARTEEEKQTLIELFSRGQQNGAKVQLVDQRRLWELEPYAGGIAGLFAPEGASFDSKGFVRALSKEARSHGAKILLSEFVTNLREKAESIEVETNKRTIGGRVLVNAAGLQADRVANKLKVGFNYQIIPFKGGYYELIPTKRHLVRSHIYPAPNLNFPFLGVHLSRTFDGRVIVGPGSVIAMGRESYGKFDFNLRDLMEMAGYSGFWRMFASKEFRSMIKREVKKSLFKKAVLEEATRLVPGLKEGDLIPSESGIRAQLVSRQGLLVDDLIIEQTPRSIHILNAVSPALTCSLPFADHIVSIVLSKLSDRNQKQRKAAC